MTSFKTEKYIQVDNLLPDDMCKIAEQYFMFDAMNGFHPEKSDYLVSNTHGRYADKLSETLLLHLKPKIEEHTELKLIPTYSFFRIYKPGDNLEHHVDRDACEITCSITIGLNYDGEIETWPLNFEKPPPEPFMDRFLLKPGDAAIYRGCEIRHGRGEFYSDDKNHYHIQLLLHYVDEAGPYAETQKYDKRPAIGYIPK